MLLALVPEHGVPVLFVATFLSCLAVPIPSSLLMLAAGAFVASGDLAALPVAAAALGGAVLGDQLGYGIGHSGGISLWIRLLAGRKLPAAKAGRRPAAPRRSCTAAPA
jgi:membrane protein DedA with SNARE-associated domain